MQGATATDPLIKTTYEQKPPIHSLSEDGPYR